MTALHTRWLRLLTAAAFGLALHGIPARAEDSDTAPLRLSVGPATYTLPRFPGSGRSHTIYFPFVDMGYDNRFYMSASDLAGVYAYKSDSVQAGVALQWDPTRRQVADNAHLRGLQNVKETARAKLFASRTVSFLTLEENLAIDTLGRGQGTISQTNLWFTAPLGRALSVNLGPGVTWTDHAYGQSFYSVPKAAATQNPLLVRYDAHAGFSDVHLNGLVECQMLAHYRLGLLAYLAHLQGDAGGSPLVQQRTQRMIMGWAAYRFR